MSVRSVSRWTSPPTWARKSSADRAWGYEEAALVQRIFRLYVEEGRSVDAIAAVLTHEGIPTATAPMRTLPVPIWHGATITRMLSNTADIGTLYEGKTQNLPGKRNPDKKSCHRRVPQEEWIPIPVPPIIELATFEAARSRAMANRWQSRRNRRYEYQLVGGRLRCGQCGARMTGETGTHGYRRYRCNRTKKPYMDVIATHSRQSVLASAVEPVIWEAVEHALNNPTLIAAEVERRRAGTSTQQTDLDHERQHYTRQVAHCDKDLKRWEDAYLGEAIDLADFKTKKADVDARRTSAERELARLDDQQHLIEQAELETASLMEYCARVWSELQHFTLEEQRRALEALNITVTWHPEWSKPKIE